MRKGTRDTGPQAEEIEKAYIIEREGSYFAGWDFNPAYDRWATTGPNAKWTEDRSKAEQVRIDSVVDRQEIMNLVVHYSRTRLLQINMEETKPTQRKPKIWTSNKY